MSEKNSEMEFLKEENKKLRELLGISNKERISERELNKAINKHSSNSDKIKLFRNLFKGREDVFAIRWENKFGKSGYSPECINRWKKGICGIPKIKCNECNHRKFKPISDQIIFDHLSGKIVVGIYPLMTGDLTNFLAIDFDKKEWQNDVTAFMKTNISLNIPAYIERSCSGNGVHIWIFFEKPALAEQARKLVSYLLTETMKTGKMLDMQSYDRLFPNQDKMPEGGFGNLIALPLQKKARYYGNSEFVNNDFQPFPDQWTFLSMVRKMKLSELSEIIKNYKTQQIKFDKSELKIENYLKLPKAVQKGEIQLIRYNQLYISKNYLPENLYYRLIRFATFSNPEFFIAQASRRSTYNIPRFITCSENLLNCIALPRGCLNNVNELFTELDLNFRIIDKRNEGKHIDARFVGQLYLKQEDAFKELIKHETGVLCASAGFGKTIIAAHLIAERKISTLVLVHRLEILEQWKEKLSVFIKGSEIGVIGGSQKRRTGEIDIAMLQTLRNKTRDYFDRYGQIIIDECHHIAAFSFEQILKKTTAKYVLGLTATPQRKDGHHPIIFMQCGPILYKTKEKTNDLNLKLFVRNTDIKVDEKIDSIQQIYAYLFKDEKRNLMIFEDVMNCLERKRYPLILTERNEHLEILKELFKGFVNNIIILQGGMGKKQKEETKKKLNSLPESEERIIIATGKYLGEGFDNTLLDTLFLTLPISWKGILQQYVGRLFRTHQKKTSIEVYDYVDKKITRLEKMFAKRKRAYKNLGFIEY